MAPLAPHRSEPGGFKIAPPVPKSRALTPMLFLAIAEDGLAMRFDSHS
jgi:hypothetical protein